MTPEEKTKHLAALESMHHDASEHVAWRREPTVPPEWRTAIDAFEAQAAEIGRLRAGLAAAQDSIYTAHDAVHEASRVIDVTLDPSDDDSNGDPPEQTPNSCNPDLELLKAAVNAIAKDIETDGRTGKRKTALSDNIGIAGRLYAITGASK